MVSTDVGLKLAQLSLKTNKRQRHRLYRKLQGMLDMNEPLPRALERLWYNAADAGKKPQNGMAKIIRMWLDKNRTGMSFSDSVVGSLPMRDALLLRAGEESGHVANSLTGIIQVDDSAGAMRAAIQKAIAYPSFMFLLLAGVLWMFGVNLIDPLRKVASPAMVAQMGSLAAVSDVIRNWGLLILIAVAAGVIGTVVSLPIWLGKVRARFDMFPPFAWYRIWQGAAFLLALSALMKSQVPLTRALEILEENGSPWLKERVFAARQEILKGANLGEALRTSGFNFPDPQIAVDLEILAERADVGKVLEMLTQEWLDEQTRNLEFQADIARSIGLGAVGSVIAWAMLSIVGLAQSLAGGHGGF